MTANVVNQVAYLRTTREFPEELHQFTVESNKAYVDTANAINIRTIGIFPTNRPAIGGESWFLMANRRQQNLRQVYTFNAPTPATIPHGLKLVEINRFTKCSGSFTDGTNWYGLLFASNVAIAGQISFFIDPTNIVINVDAGAPALTSGTIVLEWLSVP